MDYEEMKFENSFSRVEELQAQQVFPALMRKVYLWMTLALVITGFTSYYVATSPNLLTIIYGNSAVLWGLIIAELALVFGLSAAINKLSLTTATLMFVLYSVVNGATLASIFFVYTASSIAEVFFITAGTFGAMAIFGYTTKTDLASMGRLLFMALIGLILAAIVNIFVQNSMLDFVISAIGVLVFVGLTAYDSQKIKSMLMTAGDMSETTQKVALLGALTLYLDFVNLFIYLLRLLGKRE